ncbi:MAG: NAD+ synthase, partial [Pseudomonadota bacterium]|nr:NAD+ synthase [Pseudomonadota bacterium]
SYGVFDEARVFSSGPLSGPISFNNVRLGLMICEDMWEQEVAENLQETGAEIFIVINGSPFEVDKPDQRLNLAVARIKECGIPLAYVNQVGGQDELVFDGGSFVINKDCNLRIQFKTWESQVVHTKWREREDGWDCSKGTLETSYTSDQKELEHIYKAMVLGLRDYTRKNNFPGIILGLSGGIDSALSATIAVDAVGPKLVHCVMMPSPFTSDESTEDARALSENLQLKYTSIPINNGISVFDSMLKNSFIDISKDTTEENIQARIRGILIMALSNKFGYLPLTTGNKSEMSVGYSTLYGDMCGGYSVLKDAYKTTVFSLANWRNTFLPADVCGTSKQPIPERIITKKPSAELRANQFDEDTLPPYEMLDPILKNLIEGEKNLEDLIEAGYKQEIIQRIWQMLDTAEYKRRQAPPGVKLSSRAFGRDRRYPITNKFAKYL